MHRNDSLEPGESEFAEENRMWATAQLLVDIAIKSQMKIYDIDLETARDWVVRAAEAKSCGSEKQSKFTAGIAIHFPGLEGLKRPIIEVFSEVVVCPHCGKAQFVIPETQLHLLLTRKAAATE